MPRFIIIRFFIMRRFIICFRIMRFFIIIRSLLVIRTWVTSDGAAWSPFGPIGAAEAPPAPRAR
ncbi:hypothetical protein, partial [Methylobacterium sp. J-068]|uniref:hypothetical protein n=1 Tax=Methylobacterium sp. J-068 TaxID=2836649 RepID=UPI001FBBD8D8